MVLDLALFDRTGENQLWERAVARARWVAGRLAPDPEHGALIYHPGRLDPRNCSNSVIDSGECTDALARLLLHPLATNLDAKSRGQLTEAVEKNAASYLLTAVVEKGITNQRLWGAMGLTTAHALLPCKPWLDAVARSVKLAVGEQRGDGTWGYQPNATAEGAHPGAADLTVYYHSRCLAFLLHIVERLPALCDESVRSALEKGLDFMTLVTLPDGLKPLTLEGKRWFWDGSYEVGSNAYDIYALLRGAALLKREDLRDLARQSWSQLASHQRWDGANVACSEPGNADFVCPDFHTADLAWTVQALSELPDPRGSTENIGDRQPTDIRVRGVGESGVLRLDASNRSAIIRTSKLPANTQYGGDVGGGGLAAVVASNGTRLLAPGEARCRIFRRVTLGSATASWWRFLRENPIRREGRQWLFVARLLVRQRRPAAAARRLWRGYLGPMFESFEETASPEWAIDSATSTNASGAVARAPVSLRDGSVPKWAADIETVRRYASSDGLNVSFSLSGDARGVGRIEYMIPAAARSVDIKSEGLDVSRSRMTVKALPTTAVIRFDVTYTL